MTTEDVPDPAGRAGVRGRIVEQLRAHGTESAQLGHTFAARHGLQPSDLQALVAIMTADVAGEPLTPGQLRPVLGLSSGGTSVVLDRLQAAGHIDRRRDHPSDNRVVHLRHTPQGMATAATFFSPLLRRTEEIMDDFDDRELAVVARFLAAATASLRGYLEDLRAAAD